jgi:hypothetical protein
MATTAKSPGSKKAAPGTPAPTPSTGANPSATHAAR